ncbi:prepilin-type N-terminal cleavage/methylation domain-containing protein [Candidatus Dojkabacteria bacterium]|nr:prepilin-type N-terminal cleavage/methylation domain-containing protein [Candidatus Dojkabacteria bacterium]
MSLPSLLNNQKGFTILEMLLVVAAISVLAGLSIPVYQSFQVKNDVDVSANIVAQSLRRAQVLSQSVDGDSTWGVYIQSGSITIFKGTDYAGRDSSFDEVFDMSTTITPSGITEIVFSKVSGEPGSSGDIILTTSTNQVRTLNINEKGMMEYVD